MKISHLAALFLTIAFTSSLCDAEVLSSQPLRPSFRPYEMHPKNEVMAKEYEEAFGITDHLVIKDGYYSNDSIADGPISQGFTASTLKKGYYVFTFNHFNIFHFTYEVRKVILIASETTKKHDETMVSIGISPEDSAWNTYSHGIVDANVADKIEVGWSEHVFTRNGWYLVKVQFANYMAEFAQEERKKLNEEFNAAKKPTP